MKFCISCSTCTDSQIVSNLRQLTVLKSVLTLVCKVIPHLYTHYSRAEVSSLSKWSDSLWWNRSMGTERISLFLSYWLILVIFTGYIERKILLRKIHIHMLNFYMTFPKLYLPVVKNTRYARVTILHHCSFKIIIFLCIMHRETYYWYYY